MQLLQRTEDSMVHTADSMYNAYIPDSRANYSAQFAKQLVRALRVTNSWSYAFPKLAEHISILMPDDKHFRIFNWAIAPTPATVRYYGAIQMPAAQLKLYGLNDVSSKIAKGTEDSVMSNGRWLGCLYYRIMSTEVNGERVYTMFGSNASALTSNRKWLDPMRITDQGPVFGMPIFNLPSETTPGQRMNRFVLEFKKDAQVGLNWDDNIKAILFDRLVSSINDPNRKYTFVASGQYDGLRWDNNAWNLAQDVLPAQVLEDGQAPDGSSPK